MKRTLYLVPLPGVIHGSAIVSRYLVDNLATENDCIIPIQLSSNKIDSGKFSLFKLYRLIRQLINVFFYSFKVERFVLLYTSVGFVFYRDLFFRLLLINKPGILFMHNRGLKDSKTPTILKKLLFRNSRVVVLSERLKSDIHGCIEDSRVRVVPNALFGSDISEPRHRSYDRLSFLFFSNLISSKGVRESIFLVKHLIDSGVVATLDIVGNEADLTIADLRQLCLGYEKHIKIHGPLYGSEKWTRFEKANILMFPTKYSKECLPLVIIEAFANSLPVISLDTGGISDLIQHGNNGLILSGLDSFQEVEAAADIIVGVSRKEWSEMSKQAFSSYMSKYKIEKWVSAIHKVLNE